MRETFSDGFQIGFKIYRNLKELFCHSKLYDIAQPRRNETGGVTKVSTKCHKCIACRVGKFKKIPATSSGSIVAI